MTTFNGQVGASADDGVETNITSTSLSVGMDARIALRFGSVSIPAGSTITAADIQVIPDNSKVVSADWDIYAEATQDSAVLTATAGNIDNRPKTAAYVTWTATLGFGSFNVSPDIKTVIQEVINRQGWATGQHITILLFGRSSAICSFSAWDFDSGPSAAKLDITYTVNARRAYSAYGSLIVPPSPLLRPVPPWGL